MRRFLKLVTVIISTIVCIVALAIFSITLTPVQNSLVHKFTNILSSRLHTKVEIEKIRLDFFNHLLLKGVYVEDQAHDTLLYVKEAQIRLTDLLKIRGKPVIQYIGLQNPHIHLYRTSSSEKWNYDFIAESFSKKADTGATQFEIDLKKIVISDAKFYMDDAWMGSDMNYEVTNFELNTKELDLNKKILDISNISIKGGIVNLAQYAGKGAMAVDTFQGNVIDLTPFNPENWKVKVGKLSLDNCKFIFNSSPLPPIKNFFDYQHIGVTNIVATIKDIHITGDTIHGNMEFLSAKERCGLVIKSMTSRITVSPVASVCNQLRIETNNSKIQNHFAMYYKRFPNFLKFNDSVTMVYRIKDAVIDERDIAFFAPPLVQFPQVVLKASLEGRGTVTNLVTKKLNITDGKNVIKGDISLFGLPDIFKTKFTFTDGEILTSGEGIMKYAPQLKDNPSIALDKISFARFYGSYEGFLENFKLKGILNTNLGLITTNIAMDFPKFNIDSVRYLGSIMADSFDLGVLLNQTIINKVSLKEDFDGVSFNPDLAQVNLYGTVYQLQFNGYEYHNISTDGLLAKQHFEGNLLVDDPNLALRFNGKLNYSGKNVNVNAMAELLFANFKALNLTSDSFTVAADFNLDCTGSNIDNFSGYARLYNIDFKRNKHKLALDSVSLTSLGDSTNKLLTIQSNAVIARVKGNYRLSKLPASFQYYLSSYLPSYIKQPEKEAPEQNIEFSITTSNIDSILAMTFPGIRGFDTSFIAGSLNTITQKLALTGNIPFASIGKFRLSNISISALGNLNELAVSTNIENAAIGDSSISGSLGLTTTLGKDLMKFNIATTSPDSATSIVLNGEVLAHQDSLYLSLFPSTFYLNKIKWSITGNCKAVYSGNYLNIDGLTLNSGAQRIDIFSQQQGTDRIIFVNTENLELSQLGMWAGISVYHPDGRLSGSIKLTNILTQPFIAVNIRASDVKLGNDTVGNVNIVSSYDIDKKLIIVDQQTSIYHDESSVWASCKISLDENVKNSLDGEILFNNARASWANPFLAGIFSHLKGAINGKVKVKGSSKDPVIEGSIRLQNASMHLDYMGCDYTIPDGEVTLSNTKIKMEDIHIYDSYKNVAYLKGYFSHKLFKEMQMHINLSSEKFEIMKLGKADNPFFYGTLIAGMDSFTVNGPFNDISLNAYNISPQAKSHLFIPVSSTGDVATYSYITFKTNSQNKNKQILNEHGKMSIYLDANLNELAEISILLDPVSGDGILATGEGNIQLKMPANNEMRITGNYEIDAGTYTFTFQQLGLKRQFKLNSGSTISFKGPFSETSMDVLATYAVKTKLYDLMSDLEKPSLTGSDLTDAKSMQMIDVLLHMQGVLGEPKLTFDLNVEDKRMESNPGYTKLMQINQDDRQKFDQVASLLLTGTFTSPDGGVSQTTAITGAVNNVGQILSGTASTGLTKMVNKLLGERKVNINVNYQNYSYSDNAGGGSNVMSRNQLKTSVTKNYLNDRLIIEVGGTSDWGQKTSSQSSAMNITGDFRIQYQLSESSRLRLNCFRTSDYDVTLGTDIIRNGVGITWRKSFDNLTDFFRPSSYLQKKKQISEKNQ